MPRALPPDEPTTSTLLESLGILIWMLLPVATGFVLWKLWLSRRSDGTTVASAISRTVSRLGILLSATPLMLLVFWGAPLPVGKSLILPFVGISVHVFGLFAGWGVARALGYSPRRQGALLLSASSSNVLTFGGITVVLLLRSPADPFAENALGSMAIYRVFEAPFYFLFAWPLAAVVTGQGQQEGPSRRELFRRAFRNITLVPLAGIAAGCLLNVAGWNRPMAFAGISAVLVKSNVVLFGLTVGLSLRSAAPWRNLTSCLVVSVLKFVALPSVGVGLGWLLGFPGPTLQVIAICASMPVAFMAVVGAALFRLDEELVASCWLFTTGAMVAVVPVLSVAVTELGDL